MAEADDNDTSKCVWVLLGEHYEQKLAEVRAPKLADRLVRKELHGKQRHYRYLDSEGNLHQDDLSDDFWLKVSIDFATSSAVRPSRTANLFVRDPTAAAFAEVARRQAQINRTAPVSLRHMPRKTIPGLEVFRIEVLVRQQPTDHPKYPSSVSSKNVFRSRQQKLVLRVAGEVFPQGYSELNTRDIMKAVGDKIQSEGLKVPQRDVFLRALGRRK